MSKPRRQSRVEDKLVAALDNRHKANTLTQILDRVVASPEGLRGDGKTAPKMGKMGFASHKPGFDSSATSPVETASPIEVARQEANVKDLHLSASIEERIAVRVNHYWLERGWHVKASVQQVVFKSARATSHYRAARSDLVNGLPRDYRDLTDKRLGVR